MVFPQLQNNIEDNLSDQELQRIKIEELSWGDPVHLFKNWPLFDYIFAAECLYNEESVLPFLQTLFKLSNESTKIYVCGIIGDKTISLFHDQVDQYFVVSELQSDGSFTERTSTNKNNGRALYVLKKKTIVH
eukprot:TRINITY_DN2151_c0_g1_i1.p1 TRINITY_DN2151_c0_g1~~TRINITY_DN2151_c0_g1_i1.p1  ORF type:complete len:132 (-),score=14.68 TRINITY_DN2151_c0_g1_i1:106-501(-)